MDLESVASRSKKFGPLPKFRPRLPKVPAAGAAKLDVSNQGLDPTPWRIFNGATRSGVWVFPGAARPAPLAVKSKGKPDMMVMSVETRQPPITTAAGPEEAQRLPCPNGKS